VTRIALLLVVAAMSAACPVSPGPDRSTVEQELSGSGSPLVRPDDSFCGSPCFDDLDCWGDQCVRCLSGQCRGHPR
jgi:hypothetical protein